MPIGLSAQELIKVDELVAIRRPYKGLEGKAFHGIIHDAHVRSEIEKHCHPTFCATRTSPFAVRSLRTSFSSAESKRAGANIHRAADRILSQLQEAAGNGGVSTNGVAA